MRASRVIVGCVRSQQMAKMPLSEHNNVVKTFPADRTDRPFTIPVLPRRSRRGWPIPNAHRPKAADEDVTVDGVAVTDDVSRFYFPTIGLGELARNPFGGWVRSHSQPQDLAAKRRRPTLHLFADRILDQKKRLEAQVAKLQPGP